MLNGEFFLAGGGGDTCLEEIDKCTHVTRASHTPRVRIKNL